MKESWLEVFDGLISNPSGVVDEDVEPTVRGEDAADQRCALFPCFDQAGIGAREFAAPPQPIGRVFSDSRVAAPSVGVRAHVVDDNVGAPSRESLGVSAAEPAAGSRYQCYAIREVQHARHLLVP
jgi:hypothetical protein